MILTDEDGNKFEFDGHQKYNNEVFGFLKPIKETWQPEVYEDGWYIEEHASVSNTAKDGYCDDYQKDLSQAGNLYPTKQAAEEAAKLRIQRERLNQLAIHMNEQEGYEADWNNCTQAKCDVYLSASTNDYKHMVHYGFQHPGIVYVSEESAKKICDMLNSCEFVLVPKGE